MVRASVVRSIAVVLLLASLAPRMAGAAPDSGACLAPADPRQAELDRAGIARALAGGLTLNLARQCAGFSVVVQEGIDPAVAAEYAARAEQSYTRLASETGEQLSPRAVLLIFTDQESMATGERVLGGFSAAVREPRAGYAWMNTVWLDDSMQPWASARAEAVAHEFSHLFAAVTARGRAIPAWYDEGLAVDSEITLPRVEFAVASDRHTNYEHAVVLDTLSGRGPIALFALDELRTSRAWQEHYADPDEQDLEYAQAYMTLQAALESGGRPAAWRLLHTMGDAGLDFPTAFETAFGRSVEEIDARAREAWQAELARPADALNHCPPCPVG